MTEDQNLEIFGGPNGQDKPVLREFIDLMNKKRVGPAGEKTEGPFSETVSNSVS